MRWLLCAVLCLTSFIAQAAPDPIAASVVRLKVHKQRGDWSTPWNSGTPRQSSGSGFVIDGGRVMTNAHVVSDARMVLLYLHGDPTPHEARVVVAGHDCDLALVEPVEEGLLDGVPPMVLGTLPEMRSTVETYGYPAGGQRLSSTRGVVSRVEVGAYVHGGFARHVTVQTDAAINPGNSGGPVLQDGKVVGVAFQGIGQLDNVGFFIPPEIVEHFLVDLEDGTYDGFPSLGVSLANLENPAARRRAGMGEGVTGVRVDLVGPGSSSDGVLQEGDVLVAVEGVAVANEGSVARGDLRLDMRSVVDHAQVGDRLSVDVLRDGVPTTLSVPMKPLPMASTFSRIYDRLPRYYVYAGLVFVPLNAETMAVMGDLPRSIVYEARYRPLEDPDYDKEEVVILLRRLDHPVNTEMAWFRELVVEQVNGVPIRRLEDVPAAFEAGTGAHHLLEFGYFERFGALDRAAAAAAHEAILAQYGVPSDRRFGEGE